MKGAGRSVSAQKRFGDSGDLFPLLDLAEHDGGDGDADQVLDQGVALANVAGKGEAGLQGADVVVEPALAQLQHAARRQQGGEGAEVLDFVERHVEILYCQGRQLPVAMVEAHGLVGEAECGGEVGEVGADFLLRQILEEHFLVLEAERRAHGGDDLVRAGVQIAGNGSGGVAGPDPERCGVAGRLVERVGQQGVFQRAALGSAWLNGEVDDGRRLELRPGRGRRRRGGEGRQAEKQRPAEEAVSHKTSP